MHYNYFNLKTETSLLITNVFKINVHPINAFINYVNRIEFCVFPFQRLSPRTRMDIMSDANITTQINTENICDSNYLKSLIEERDKKEKLPFENLIFTSKKR